MLGVFKTKRYNFLSELNKMLETASTLRAELELTEKQSEDCLEASYTAEMKCRSTQEELETSQQNISSLEQQISKKHHDIELVESKNRALSAKLNILLEKLKDNNTHSSDDLVKWSVEKILGERKNPSTGRIEYWVRYVTKDGEKSKDGCTDDVMEYEELVMDFYRKRVFTRRRS
eukprot:388837_1